mgnify:CR=1 FL=1
MEFSQSTHLLNTDSGRSTPLFAYYVFEYVSSVFDHFRAG